MKKLKLFLVLICLSMVVITSFPATIVKGQATDNVGDTDDSFTNAKYQEICNRSSQSLVYGCQSTSANSMMSNTEEITLPTSTEALSIAVVENVTIRENGTSQLALLINVLPSPLVEMYRKSLAAPTNVSVGEEVSLPENMILVGKAKAGEDDTQILIPVREAFYESIERQQLSLGFLVEISDSKMVPKSDHNGCRVHMNGNVVLPLVAVTRADSYDEWRIAVGPRDSDGIGLAIGSTFTSMELIQMMLESLPGEQIYECSWSTRIELPAYAGLLDSGKISELNWKIDFGGGTYMRAKASLDGASAVILDERTVVTEQKIAATPKYLFEAFSQYKVFTIEYLAPHSSSADLESNEATDATGDTWSYMWTMDWSDTISGTFEYGPLNAMLTVSASITLSGYVGWDIGLFEGLTRFESWMSLETSVEVDFRATATASFSRSWEKTIGWKTTFYFMVGVVPVWADFEITATGVLAVNAYGELEVTAGAEAWGYFKAGVKWTNYAGWSDIFEVDTHASYSGPNIEAKAGVWIRPSVKFRLAFLFYSVAGPFIEFEPYATATVTCSYPPPKGAWEVTVNLKITAGATFAGWLKTLLGLDDWAIILYDQVLARWSGSWGPSSISITETLSPSTCPPSSSVLVYGTATFNDGSPVSLTDVVVTITQTGASWTTTTNSGGSYSQYVSAPTSEGTYTVRVDIATGSFAGSNSKSLTVKKKDGGARYTLYRTTTCKDVQSDNPYDPICECMVFRRSDEKVWTWVHLTDVYKYGAKSPLIKVRWEWISPTNNLYWDSERTIPDPGEGYYWEWFKCAKYIWIAGHGAEDMEGRWHCKLYINEGSGYELKKVHDFVIGYEVTDRTMAKDVQSSNPYEPIDRTNSFLNTYARAWAWIRIDEVAENLEIKWEWYEPSGAKYFEFFWTFSDPGSGCSYWDWAKYWCYIYISGHSAQSKLGSWEVRSYIQDVYGNWDLEYSQYFAISDNTPPGTPGTPTDNGDYSTTGTVTWTWTAALEDGTVANYQIQVGTTPGGNNVFDGYVGSLSKTLYDLQSGFTYYARVRAMNTVGQWGSWSGVSDGIAVDRPPMSLLIEGPSGTINHNDVIFSWIGSDDVTPTSNLVYSYFLEGYDSSWSPWASDTSKQYYDLPDSSYVFKVKTKDQIGNVDPTPAETSFKIDTVRPTTTI